MNFHLSQPYQYAHLKMWFAENKSKLPDSIGIYKDVRKAVETNILAVEYQINRFDRVTNMREASERILFTIYETMKKERQ